MPLLLGAVLGLPLGVGVGYFGSAPWNVSPGMGQAILLLGIAFGLLIVLTAWASIKASTVPLVVAAGMVAAGVLGVLVAPGAPGSSQHASGTGSVGTPQDPTVFWSGSVTCDWYKEQDSRVRSVAGFDVQVSDAAVAKALGVNRGARVVAIGLDALRGSAMLGVGEDSNHYTSTGSQLILKGVSADGRSGTAVAPNETMVFSWFCTQGP